MSYPYRIVLIAFANPVICIIWSFIQVKSTMMLSWGLASHLAIIILVTIVEIIHSKKEVFWSAFVVNFFPLLWLGMTSSARPGKLIYLGFAVLAILFLILIRGRVRSISFEKIDGSFLTLLPLVFLVGFSGTINQKLKNQFFPATDPLKVKTASFSFKCIGYEEQIQTEDKVYVLEFWATWCKPCIELAPLFNQVRAHYKNDPRVVFLAPNTDLKVSLNKIMNTSSRIGYDDILVLDNKNYFGDSLGLSLIPATIIQDGKVLLTSMIGSKDYEKELIEQIDEALKYSIN